jgi:AraC-like DNA-binding protein
MYLGGSPLLERQRIFHTRDVGEAEGFLNPIGFRFQSLARPRAALDVRLNGVYFPGMYFGYVQYGVAATVDITAARADYWIQLPVRGGVETSDGSWTVACDRRTACIASPGRDIHMRVEEAGARTQLSLTAPALLRQLAALLGETLHGPLEFQPAIDLTRGYGLSLARYLSMIVADLEQDGATFMTPLVMSQVEQLILTTLLLSHRHNYSDRLRGAHRPVAPGDVKRAVDYLHEHIEAPVTLADLVAITGVPGRTLFQHFRAFKGVSPMRYLRNARLWAARETLQRGAPGETVTSVASRLGFAHMGRFSHYYRTAFGERPSDTLARARGIERAASVPRTVSRPLAVARPNGAFRVPSAIKEDYWRFS